MTTPDDYITLTRVPLPGNGPINDGRVLVFLDEPSLYVAHTKALHKRRGQYVAHHVSLGIDAAAASREELLEEVYSQVRFLWTNYVEDDHTDSMTEGAKDLRAYWLLRVRCEGGQTPTREEPADPLTAYCESDARLTTQLHELGKFDAWILIKARRMERLLLEDGILPLGGYQDTALDFWDMRDMVKSAFQTIQKVKLEDPVPDCPFGRSCTQVGSLGVHTFSPTTDRCVHCNAEDPNP